MQCPFWIAHRRTHRSASGAAREVTDHVGGGRWNPRSVGDSRSWREEVPGLCHLPEVRSGDWISDALRALPAARRRHQTLKLFWSWLRYQWRLLADDAGGSAIGLSATGAYAPSPMMVLVYNQNRTSETPLFYALCRLSNSPRGLDREVRIKDISTTRLRSR
jgi:hypothetical protein